MKLRFRVLFDSCLWFQVLLYLGDFIITHTRKWSCSTRPVVTPALSKTCRRAGTTTPPAPASSVEECGVTHHHPTLVRRSPGLRSPLYPSSDSDRRDIITSAGACLGLGMMMTRSSSLVADPPPLRLRLFRDHQALRVLTWHTRQCKS